MTRITLDAFTVQRLRESSSPVEFCDESGNVLGRFLPATPRKQHWEPAFTEGELEAMEREEGGRSLEEILTELRKCGAHQGDLEAPGRPRM